MRSSCRHAREPCCTRGRQKSKSLLMLTDERLDGMSKNHLLPLEFPKLPSPVHSSGRKLVVHMCIFTDLVSLLCHQYVDIEK